MTSAGFGTGSKGTSTELAKVETSFFVVLCLDLERLQFGMYGPSIVQPIILEPLDRPVHTVQ